MWKNHVFCPHFPTTKFVLSIVSLWLVNSNYSRLYEFLFVLAYSRRETSSSVSIRSYNFEVAFECSPFNSQSFIISNWRFSSNLPGNHALFNLWQIFISNLEQLYLLVLCLFCSLIRILISNLLPINTSRRVFCVNWNVLPKINAL